MEEWAPIEDFPAYEVSSEGRIRREATGRLLGIYENGNGYLQVVLSRDGRPYARAVHRLVALAFLDLPPDDSYVPIFIDGDHYNIHASNLEWKPRWFANQRTRQMNRRHPRDPRPILMEKTGQTFDNALECAKAIGGLEHLVLLTAQSPYGATYMGSTFRFI